MSLLELDHLDEKDESDKDGDMDAQCGCGSCRPRLLQKFANIASFTGFFSIASLLSSTLLSYVNSQVTTLERQFGLSSSETGIVLASNDIGYMAVTFFIGHFALRSHIPRVMSVSVMLFGVSGIICCLPHFLFGAGQIPGQRTDILNVTTKSRDSAIQLCVVENDTFTDICDGSEDFSKAEALSRSPREHTSVALAIIVIGMLLQGVAKAPRNPFVITYVDDNVEKVKTGYYLGIIVSTSIFGPAIAFGLGSYFTRLYVTLGDTDLYPRHPRWIGAWWLGYLVFGVAAILVSIPVFLFPRRLKTSQRKKNEARSKEQKTKTISTRLLSDAKDYVRILFSVVTTPVYMCLLLSSVIHAFAIGGGQAFTPKYLEVQFGIVAWKANLLMAGLGMPAAALGTFVGGWLMKKYKMTPMTSLKFVIIGLSISVGLVALGYVFGCPQPGIIGHPRVVAVSETTQDVCSSTDCHCKEDFFPICGSDNVNYYSPCQAGCLIQDGPDFKNCSCIGNDGIASAGTCDYDCPYLYPYVITKAAVSLISTLVLMPKYITTIRSVTQNEKPMAIAFSSCVTSLLGWLVGPIVYGRVIDTACLIWDSSCGQRGSCALYDIVDFRLKMHGVYVVSRGLAVLALVLAMVIAKKTKKFEKTMEAWESK